MSPDVAKIPDEVYYPVGGACIRKLLATIFGLALLGAWAMWFTGESPEMFAFAFTLVIMSLPAVYFIKLYKYRREKIFLHGEEHEATIVRRYTTPIGPIYKLVATYDMDGVLITATSRVPSTIYWNVRPETVVIIKILRKWPSDWVFLRIKDSDSMK